MKLTGMLSILMLAPPAALADTPASQPAATAAAATSADKKVEDTASPEIVGHLVKDLAITPAQAEGAAGALFGLAKKGLKAEDFTKVATAVPNMDGLLKAAPVLEDKGSPLTALAAQAGGLASLAPAFTKLGLKPETIAKLAPSLIAAVKSKGGAEVANLLGGVLK